MASRPWPPETRAACSAKVMSLRAFLKSCGVWAMSCPRQRRRRDFSALVTRSIPLWYRQLSMSTFPRPDSALLDCEHGIDRIGQLLSHRQCAKAKMIQVAIERLRDLIVALVQVVGSAPNPVVLIA